MTCPLDYSLCCQSVTVYRLQAGKVCRQVFDRAFLAPKGVQTTGPEGEGQSMPFHLILPGAEVFLFPGDKVFHGIGPEVTESTWWGFLPATVPGLYIVEYVKPCYWMGAQCHLEAGSIAR